MRNIMSKRGWVPAYTHVTLSVHWSIDDRVIQFSRSGYNIQVGKTGS